LSGRSLADVRVHFNSSKPTRIQALAYTQGRDIELAPGQDHHLPHEAWHVVQQMEGRVRPMRRVGGVAVNSDQRLEREATVMGERARSLGGVVWGAGQPARIARSTSPVPVVQRERGLKRGDEVIVTITEDRNVDDFDAVIEDVTDDGRTYTVRYVVDDYNEVFPTKVDETTVRARRVKKVSFVDKSELSTTPWEAPALGLSGQVLDDIKKIAGDAGRISYLSEDQLEDMIAYFGKPELQPLSTPVNAFVAELVEDLRTLQLQNERPEQVRERAASINAEITAAENEAFATQFGIDVDKATWNEVLPTIAKWYDEVKAAERQAAVDLDAFHVAFRSNRMTARQINVADTARGGVFKVKHADKTSKNPERKIFLDNTVEGIAKRMDKGNFADEATRNAQGVHDLSASILDGSKEIFKQLKFYTDSVALFMPLPEEKDLRILSALARVKGVREDQLKGAHSLITHPRLAQSSDMGTTFVDTTSGEGGEGSFAYGLTGTVIRKPGDRARKINEADLAARRKGALFYVQVATAGITTVNEIVMAYRRHESGIFPMYARWDKAKGHFVVVRANKEPTGMIITNDGHYRKG
jgi:hypothetical protein